MVFDVKGMTCAACSAHVERSVSKVDGVRAVRVSLLSNTMEVDFDPARTSPDGICAAVAAGGYSARPKGSDRVEREVTDEARAVLRRLLMSAALLVPLMGVAMGDMLGLPLPHALHYPLVNALAQLFLAAPVLLLNRHYFTNGFRALLHGAPNMNSLISVGAAAGTLYSVALLFWVAIRVSAGEPVGMTVFYFESAAMIVTLISIGKYLEARAKGKTSEAIAKLVDLAPKRATVLRDGAECEIDASEIRVGDLVLVREGQTVPADGVIERGSGALDQSMLTGESVPVERGVGESVVGATVNVSGCFCFRVTKVGEETALSRIIRLVEAAANSKAPISRLADRVAGVFVPIVMGIAAVTLVVWLLLGAGLSVALKRCIAVLVISCPCSLGLATPTAIMAATGKGAELGLLIKSAASLETAHAIDCVAFDKTGTLTRGRMQLVATWGATMPLLSRAASVEASSSHPVAKAIVAEAERRGVTYRPTSDYASHIGKGVEALVDGERVRVGREAWLLECGLDLSPVSAWAEARRAEGATVLFAAAGQALLGAMALQDTLRPTAEETVRSLNSLGVKTVLLTGDNERTARALANRLGVTEIHAQLMPEDKETAIRALQAQGHAVMMVGDGINDAPALVRADLGAAVGRGTDVAIESADAVFVRDEPALAVGLIRLGRATIRNIKQNLFWAFFYNAIGIPLAAGALVPLGIDLDPMFAAAAMSASSLTVVTNALRLRRLRFDLPETDEAGFREASIIKEEMNMKTVKIEGMMCMHCVAHVKKALSALDPGVEVKLEEKCAVLSAAVADEAIRKAVTDAGYEVTEIR